MQKNYSTLYGNQIHDPEGNLIGMLLDCVFEKETGKILAYQVLADGGERRYLLPTDIKTWIGDLLIIRDEDCLETLANLYRVQEGILLLKTPVVNLASETLGEIMNYWIDPKNDLLTQIEVARKFLFLFKREVRLFPQTRIAKMDADEIVVDDDSRSVIFNLEKVKN